MDNLFLCRPCAERMKDFVTVRSVKMVAPRKQKGTCDQCNRRRFGYDCQVEFED